MPSLLEYLMQQSGQGRATTAGGLLHERARARGLLDGVETPPPDLFTPGQPASLPQLQGSAGVQHGAPPQMPEPPQAQPQVQMQDSQRALRQAIQQQEIQLISRVTRGNVPDAALPWIEETAEESANSGPGRPGRPFLARLFAGDKVPGLSDEQNKMLRKQALFYAGLAILSTPHGTSFGQALAIGILAGRSVATQTAGALLDEQHAQARIQERMQVLQNVDMTELDRWSEVRRRAVAEGDLEAAKVINDVIADLRDMAAGEAESTFIQVNGQTYALDPDGVTIRDPFTREVVSQAPTGSELVTVNTPAGPRTYRLNPDQSLSDPFTGQIVQAAPQAAPEPEDLDSTRLGQVDQDLRTLRREERGVAQILESVGAIARKLESTGSISSADMRELATRLTQAMSASNLRESGLEAIAASGGLVGTLENAIGQLQGGQASPTVAKDLLQAIQRAGGIARRTLEQEREDNERRVRTIRGIRPEEAEAVMGRSPFGARSEPEPEEDDNPFDAAFRARRGQVNR
jgi:hypothetical protein